MQPHQFPQPVGYGYPVYFLAPPPTSEVDRDCGVVNRNRTPHGGSDREDRFFDDDARRRERSGVAGSSCGWNGGRRSEGPCRPVPSAHRRPPHYLISLRLNVGFPLVRLRESLIYFGSCTHTWIVELTDPPPILPPYLHNLHAHLNPIQESSSKFKPQDGKFGQGDDGAAAGGAPAPAQVRRQAGEEDHLHRCVPCGPAGVSVGKQVGLGAL